MWTPVGKWYETGGLKTERGLHLLWSSSWGVCLLLHSVAGAFDEDGLGVVEEAVEDGGSEGVVVVEDAGPLFEWLVGGEQYGTALVASADDLEEEVGALLVDGQIAEFVEDEEAGAEIFFEFLG